MNEQLNPSVSPPTPAEIRHSEVGTAEQMMRISQKLADRAFLMPLEIHPDLPRYATFDAPVADGSGKNRIFKAIVKTDRPGELESLGTWESDGGFRNGKRSSIAPTGAWQYGRDNAKLEVDVTRGWKHEGVRVGEGSVEGVKTSGSMVERRKDLKLKQSRAVAAMAFSDLRSAMGNGVKKSR